MRVFVQRVSEAQVLVSDKCVGKIAHGLLVLAAWEDADTDDDLDWMASKIVNQRIFADEQGKMNKSVKDIGGQILLVSQFTLFASTKKGNRPSFMQSAKPELAENLYLKFKSKLSALIQKEVECGQFGAHMKVALVNDGPVSIWMDSQQKS